MMEALWREIEQCIESTKDGGGRYSQAQSSTVRRRDNDGGDDNNSDGSADGKRMRCSATLVTNAIDDGDALVGRLGAALQRVDTPQSRDQAEHLLDLGVRLWHSVNNYRVAGSGSSSSTAGEDDEKANALASNQNAADMRAKSATSAVAIARATGAAVPAASVLPTSTRSAATMGAYRLRAPHLARVALVAVDLMYMAVCVLGGISERYEIDIVRLYAAVGADFLRLQDESSSGGSDSEDDSDDGSHDALACEPAPAQRQRTTNESRPQRDRSWQHARRRHAAATELAQAEACLRKAQSALHDVRCNGEAKRTESARFGRLPAHDGPDDPTQRHSASAYERRHPGVGFVLGIALAECAWHRDRMEEAYAQVRRAVGAFRAHRFPHRQRQPLRHQRGRRQDDNAGREHTQHPMPLMHGAHDRHRSCTPTENGDDDCDGDDMLVGYAEAVSYDAALSAFRSMANRTALAMLAPYRDDHCAQHELVDANGTARARDIDVPQMPPAAANLAALCHCEAGSLDSARRYAEANTRRYDADNAFVRVLLAVRNGDRGAQVAGVGLVTECAVRGAGDDDNGAAVGGSGGGRRTEILLEALATVASNDADNAAPCVARVKQVLAEHARRCNSCDGENDDVGDGDDGPMSRGNSASARQDWCRNASQMYLDVLLAHQSDVKLDDVRALVALDGGTYHRAGDRMRDDTVTLLLQYVAAALDCQREGDGANTLQACVHTAHDCIVALMPLLRGRAGRVLAVRQFACYALALLLQHPQLQQHDECWRRDQRAGGAHVRAVADDDGDCGLAKGVDDARDPAATVEHAADALLHVRTASLFRAHLWMMRGRPADALRSTDDALRGLDDGVCGSNNATAVQRAAGGCDRIDCDGGNGGDDADGNNSRTGDCRCHSADADERRQNLAPLVLGLLERAAPFDAALSLSCAHFLIGRPARLASAARTLPSHALALRIMRLLAGAYQRGGDFDAHSAALIDALRRLLPLARTADADEHTLRPVLCALWNIRARSLLATSRGTTDDVAPRTEAAAARLCSAIAGAFGAQLPALHAQHARASSLLSVAAELLTAERTCLQTDAHDVGLGHADGDDNGTRSDSAADAGGGSAPASDAFTRIVRDALQAVEREQQSAPVPTPGHRRSDARSPSPSPATASEREPACDGTHAEQCDIVAALLEVYCRASLRDFDGACDRIQRALDSMRRQRVTRLHVHALRYFCGALLQGAHILDESTDSALRHVSRRMVTLSAACVRAMLAGMRTRSAPGSNGDGDDNDSGSVTSDDVLCREFAADTSRYVRAWLLLASRVPHSAPHASSTPRRSHAHPDAHNQAPATRTPSQWQQRQQRRREARHRQSADTPSDGYVLVSMAASVAHSPHFPRDELAWLTRYCEGRAVACRNAAMRERARLWADLASALGAGATGVRCGSATRQSPAWPHTA